LGSGQLTSFLETAEKVHALAYTLDGKTAAGVLYRPDLTAAEIVVFDVASRGPKQTFRGHKGIVQDLTFSRDGTLLVSASHDGTVRVWDLIRGREQAVCIGHQGEVRAVEIAPDQETIVSASQDKTVKLWDPVTGQERLTLTFEGRIAASVAFWPDGQSLAVGWGPSQTVLGTPGTATLYRAPRP
jgi:WD40 repeat protein